MLRLARAQDGNDYISIGFSKILVTPGPSRPPAPPVGLGGGNLKTDIVSGQGSSAVKTRDCWARGRSRRKCQYFLRNFNAFGWSRQRSRLVLGAVKAEMLVFPMEFQYFLIVSGEGSSAVKTHEF